MADILGNIVSGIFGIGGEAQNFAHQSALQQQQNEFNLQMWRMNNEYNSPQAQMQRFKDAGLNPNLIYGQGSNGNSSSPPVMGTPQAPNYSRSMERLAQAFNIEGLRTQIADRKKAEEEAKQAKLATYEFEDEREAKKDFSLLYSFNPSKGIYEFTPGVEVVGMNNPRGHKYGFKAQTRGYYFNKYVSDNYYRGSLIPYKMALYQQQKNFLVPQVSMANYDAQYYPWSYWIDRGAKAAHAGAELINAFNPLRFKGVPKFKQQPYKYKNPYNNPYTQPDYSELPF